MKKVLNENVCFRNFFRNYDLRPICKKKWILTSAIVTNANIWLSVKCLEENRQSLATAEN
jgi:hypothetical protein